MNQVGLPAAPEIFRPDDPARLVRLGLWVYVVIVGASIGADFLGGRADANTMGTYRALGGGAALVGALVLRRQRQRARTVIPLVVSVIVVAALLQDRVSRDPYSTLLLTATISLVIAVILPWSWRDQLRIATISSLGILANWSIVHGPPFLVVNAILGCVASVGIALFLERERVALAQSHARASVSEARLRQIADNAREVFWTLEVGGDQADLSYISPASEALLGFTPAQSGVHIQALLDRIHPDDREALAARLRLARDVQSPGAIDFRIVTPAGATRHVQARFNPIRDDTGTLVRLGGVLEDVTTERQAAAALERARDEAQMTARSRSNFLAAMSHEISTPLTAILGTLDLLRESGTTAVQRRRLETVHTCAQSLHLLLSDVLDFSKSEAGELRLRLADFDLGELLAGMVELHAARARARGLDLHFEWAGGLLASTVGDAGRLRQVLNNLVSNAIKFTPAGEVCVRATPLGDRQGSVRFEVTDTGIGVPVAVRQRIFEPFTQADESIAPRYGGTGLGLAIGARMVELMGGTIGVESAGAAGSRFWFTVPLGTGPLEPSSTISPCHKRLLVLAHDEASGERLLADLRCVGITGRAVTGPDAAIVALRSAMDAADEFDAIIMVVDGERRSRETLHALLTNRVVAPVPAIMVVATRGRGGDAVVAYEGGAADWQAAPLRPATLVERVSETERPAGGQPSSGRRSPKARGRILVVDDSEIVREVVVEMLCRMGHGTEAVSSGRQALDALQWQRFDLVLLDCQMPEMDGFETAQRIRAAEVGTGARTSIIAFSAGAPEIYRERCVRAGMDDCLAKPVRPDALAEVVARWLRPAPQPHPVDKAVLDRDRLSDLAGHDTAIMRRLYALFLSEARAVISKIATVADGGDAHLLEADVHRARGAAVYIGAVQFEEQLAHASAAQADPAALRALVPALTAALDQFGHSLRELERDLSRVAAP